MQYEAALTIDGVNMIENVISRILKQDILRRPDSIEAQLSKSLTSSYKARTIILYYIM